MVSAGEVGERLVGMVGRVSSPRFVDRRKELAAIEAALTRSARRARARWCSSAARQVSGKTRLISELAGRAEREQMTVVVGECLPLGDGEIPYAPVVGAVRSLLAQREGTELEAMLDSARDELAVLLPELASGRRCGWPAGWGRDRRRACSSSCSRCWQPRPGRGR